MPKMTDINKLPPFPKGMGSGSALGFTIDEDDPTIRYKIWYGSEEERAFCECSELCSSKQWKEAREKFDNLSELAYRFDWKLYARISTGIYMQNSSNKRQFDEACKSIRNWASNDSSGGESDEIFEKLQELIEARENNLLSHYDEDGDPNFDKASTAVLVEVASLWRQLFVLAEDNGICIIDYAPDLPQERHQDIVEALVKRKDYKSARDIIKKLFQVTTAIGENYYIQRFYVFDAELAEAMGKRSDAHEAYTKASEIDSDYDRYNDHDGGNELHGSHVESVPSGTLEQRIERTTL